MYGKTGDTEMQVHKQRHSRLVHSLLFISETSKHASKGSGNKNVFNFRLQQRFPTCDLRGRGE